MSTGERKTASERTDARLRAERDRTDEELLERSQALEEQADAIVQRARARARKVLALARGREDTQLEHADADTSVLAAVAHTRDREDAALAREYEDADATLLDEREQRRHAIIQLLALEREGTDRSLAAERVAVERALHTREDVLAIAGHDLRNMLGLILTNATVLALAHDPANTATVAESIQRTAAQMAQVLDDLLDFATLESGRAALRRAAMDLGELARAAIVAHTPAASAAGLTLSLELEEGSLALDADAARLGRVVLNLVGNALKFTPAGGRVTVRVARAGDELELAVADTGPGIAPEQLQTIFEPFRRLEAAGRARGLGLGLHIARTIVAAHDGRIWAESTVGAGATFLVRLPAGSAAP